MNTRYRQRLRTEQQHRRSKIHKKWNKLSRLNKQKWKKAKLICILKGETPGLWMAVSCPPGKTENTRRRNTRLRRDDALEFVRRQLVECKKFITTHEIP